jgi:transposase-like protein
MRLQDFVAIVQDKSSTIEYLRCNGLLASKATCQECDQQMSIQTLRRSIDDQTFRCSQCKKTRSIRVGSIFEGSHLSLSDLFAIIYLMSAGITQTSIAEMLNIALTTVIEWELKLRDVYSRKLRTTDLRLGGQDVVVQIDESVLAKAKPTRNRHARPVKTQWMFGLYDCSRRVGIVRAVPNRTSGTLLPIISEQCMPGTIIRSDGWAAYANIESIGFRHEVVVHEDNFVDPVTGCNTNAVEAYWKRAKAKLKRMSGTYRHMLDSYIDEFMWSERYGGIFSEKIYYTALHIAEAYPIDVIEN